MFGVVPGRCWFHWFSFSDLMVLCLKGGVVMVCFGFPIVVLTCICVLIVCVVCVLYVGRLPHETVFGRDDRKMAAMPKYIV